MKNYFFVLLLFPLVSCGNGQRKADCLQLYNEAATALEGYYYDKDPDALESHLGRLEYVIERCGDLKYGAALLKSEMLQSLGRYNEAAVSVRTVPDSVFELSYHKGLLINKFYALQSLAEGDLPKMESYVNKIVRGIEDFMEKEKEFIIPVLQSQAPDEIYRSKYANILFEYFYYKYQIEDSGEISGQIDLLRDSIAGNPIYFDDIKNYMGEDILFRNLYR